MQEGRNTSMVKLEDTVIARYTHAGNHFEILVDPKLALALKRGQEVDMDNLLATDEVFSDARKETRQSESMINKVFGTTDINTIAKKIIQEGEVQLTTEQRRELREEKRKAIVDFIARNAMNPQSQSPHPPIRIENAMTEAKIQVDEFKDVMQQVNEIIPKLRRLLPISMERIQVAIKVPAQYASPALTVLHKFGLKKQEWQNDGGLIAVVEIPGGMKQELFDKLNHVSHGGVTTKLLEKPIA